jgi:NADPH-dependent glutamate synthase beta subunit-like oxidoreductase/NAD(P)H-flavin reductase
MTPIESRPRFHEDTVPHNIPLGVPGFFFADIHRADRLPALDAAFLDTLETGDADLAARLRAARADRGASLDATALSDLLVAVGPYVGRFVNRLFGIEADAGRINRRALDDAPIFECRRLLLERRVWKTPPTPEQVSAIDPTAAETGYREVVTRRLDPTSPVEDPERELGLVGKALLDAEAAAKAAADADESARVVADIEAVGRWATILAFHPKYRETTREWALFARPEKVDFEELVERQFEAQRAPGYFEGPEKHRRFRDGFPLTDPRQTPRQALGEMHYCILCHERKKDSCRHGFPEGPVVQPKFGGSHKKNPLGIPMTGCPLDEKISEAHALKRTGHALSALAMVMVDNPLCAGTGHRICNDCMKGCIYQKQTPVNIPQAETNILTDVLALPYGFEIYSLLMRWNPLNVKRPYALPYNGRNVLVVGMGPAGYTLAHYLLNEGFGVVGIEGLKVEPQAERLSGGDPHVPRPIRNIEEITTRLDRRVILGFGGVSEYGITVRWDKNFLDINYHALMRRSRFRLYDGVRFGGTMTIDDAWGMGFHHVAIAAGAGRPTLLSAKNSLLRGVRAASDFLMGLQGTGIYRKKSLGNLQVELPALVVGGGLTAIDTATEMQAYYVIQVERTLERWETLVAERGEAEVRSHFGPEELASIERWLAHGRAVREERAAAARKARTPDFARLMKAWGGVTIVYRKRLQDSPAYRLNHEEVAKALEEGIGFAECLNPVEFVPGADGALVSVKLERQLLADGQWSATGDIIEMPARSVMVAAGTRPNAIYEKEHPGTLVMDPGGEFFQGHRLTDSGALEPVPRGKGVGFFTSYRKDGRFITFYGDNHPVYAGNVVKAMASAKDGYPEVVRVFAGELAALDPADQLDRDFAWTRFTAVLDDQLKATVVDVIRLTPTIIEVILRAPFAARKFQPGQFYRLQNYETRAEVVDGHPLAMEGLAVTGAWVDAERGLISTILLEMGGSSQLCALLKPGEPVVLLGPTGTPTEIPHGETVVLVGGGLGNAVLFSIADALKANGNRVLYFAGYKKPGDLYKRSEIEKACDLVVWACDEAPGIPARRPQDRSVVGNIVEAMSAYASGRLGPVEIPLSDVTRLVTIGSDRMMAAVKTARKTVLGGCMKPDHVAIGSINSPMQCMMKEICAQCLQRHIDPETGRETYVFSCFNQDQELDRVDFDHLAERLKQNSASEKLTAQWIERLLARRNEGAAHPTSWRAT